MGLSNDIVYVKILIDLLKIKMMSVYSFLQWLQSVYSFFVRTMKLKCAMNDDHLAQLHQSTYIMASCLSLCSVYDT